MGSVSTETEKTGLFSPCEDPKEASTTDALRGEVEVASWTGRSENFWNKGCY